jgi:hypothetical protein
MAESKNTWSKGSMRTTPAYLAFLSTKSHFLGRGDYLDSFKDYTQTRSLQAAAQTISSIQNNMNDEKTTLYVCNLRMMNRHNIDLDMTR